MERLRLQKVNTEQGGHHGCPGAAITGLYQCCNASLPGCCHQEQLLKIRQDASLSFRACKNNAFRNSLDAAPMTLPECGETSRFRKTIKSHYPLIQFLAFVSIKITCSLSCWSQATRANLEALLCRAQTLALKIGLIGEEGERNSSRNEKRGDRTFLTFRPHAFRKILGNHRPRGTLCRYLAEILRGFWILMDPQPSGCVVGAVQ